MIDVSRTMRKLDRNTEKMLWSFFTKLCGKKKKKQVHLHSYLGFSCLYTQLLWQCYDAIYHQIEDRRIQSWPQLVITKVNPNLNTNTILHCTRSLSRTIRFGRLKEHKNKGKVIWVIPKVITVAYWSGHLRDLFITKFKGQMNQNSDFFFSFEFTVH